VLEAAGAASIKFRERDILATAHRIDHMLVSLDIEMKAALSARNSETVSELEKQIKKREKMLLGVYQQVAVHFADLHDTPGRMKAKGVIRRQVQWAESRTFFYWRLCRRMREFEYARLTKAASRKEAVVELHDWFLTAGGHETTWEDDKQLVSWLEEYAAKVRGHATDLINLLLAKELASSLSAIADSSAAAELVRKALAQLPDDKRKQIIAAFKE
jgi:acetyl-CoA carboxylase/biotin carboxylase 1